MSRYGYMKYIIERACTAKAINHHHQHRWRCGRETDLLVTAAHWPSSNVSALCASGVGPSWHKVDSFHISDPSPLITTLGT